MVWEDGWGDLASYPMRPAGRTYLGVKAPPAVELGDTYKAKFPNGTRVKSVLEQKNVSN